MSTFALLLPWATFYHQKPKKTCSVPFQFTVLLLKILTISKNFAFQVLFARWGERWNLAKFWSVLLWLWAGVLCIGNDHLLLKLLLLLHCCPWQRFTSTMSNEMMKMTLKKLEPSPPHSSCWKISQFTSLVSLLSQKEAEWIEKEVSTYLCFV